MTTLKITFNLHYYGNKSPELCKVIQWHWRCEYDRPMNDFDVDIRTEVIGDYKCYFDDKEYIMSWADQIIKNIGTFHEHNYKTEITQSISQI